MSTTIETWLPEARQMAAQCWCDETTKHLVMEPALAEAVAYKIAAWMETGAFHARNEEYWRERGKKAARLQRKLEQRDRRIAGLQRRIAKLEHSLSIRSGDAVVVDFNNLRRDIAKAVTEALCNVRMIPVMGIGKQSKILEVRASDPEVKP